MESKNNILFYIVKHIKNDSDKHNKYQYICGWRDNGLDPSRHGSQNRL